ncbi:unnamed protein product [Angiostrongylus costaricensis]|uniref:ANK_REP_REGION domain-containing protein n=1 Tax=Angiostrongylus costaricensis TaxID=334426 RepID=A0A158PDN4_ANGCS|nr:unnamed protein product [Angiostrongylus costaricensis]
MWSSSKDDVLNVRVEKGKRPRLKISEDKKTIQHERKPELIIYASALSHEKDIKIQVKEMNTRIHQIGIAGPNLDVVGALRVSWLNLEATVGTMHVNAKVVADRLSLHGQSIVIASEALLSTDKLTVIGRKLQLDGRCFPNENSKNRGMIVQFNCGLVHVGVDGCIGESNERETTRTTKKVHPVHIISESLSLTITGSLANYGKILASDRIDLLIGGNLLSLSDGTLDSAGRGGLSLYFTWFLHSLSGYDALKQIRGVRTRNDCIPSSTSLHSAINSQNADAVADLIEKGVDVNDKISSKVLTLRQAAIAQCREKREQSKLNRVRERITLINALLAVHDWRRGSIQSRAIRAVVNKNCDDCAQFNARELQIKVGGSATAEADSIWSSAYVELDVGTTVAIAGQVKLTSLFLTAGSTLTTTADAIVALEMFGRFNCERFDALNLLLKKLVKWRFLCDGIWTVGENFVLDVRGDVRFGTNSYTETEKMEMVSGSTCLIDGSWQIGTCWVLIESKLTIGAAAKLFIEDSATVGALGLMCHGFCNVAETCDLQFKNSAHFFHSSKLECRTLKISCELHCTLGGVWIADTMMAYVRHDLITTSTGKAAVFTHANLTVGSFRNDSLWQMEKDCHIVVGCMEQSEDGTMFVKQTLKLYIHRDSVGCFAGRIVCSRLDMRYFDNINFATVLLLCVTIIYSRCLRQCQYDGYLKTNDAEIYLPYMFESQLIVTGHLDILVSPLTLKGNSSFVDATPSAAHPFPAFVLSGRLNAYAIIAPFLAVEFSPESLVKLRGISSTTPGAEFNILVSAGALATRKGSSLLSIGENPRAEGIICATTFYHEGQIRFQAEDVHILTGAFLHKGRLTNCEHKQNHVKRCHFVVEELFLNEGTLACNVLEIVGEGVLENRNRIFAVDTMNIRLNDFTNSEGLIESKNSIKLLSATKEWTKLGGSIKAKRNFDFCAHKLDMALNDVHKLNTEKKLSFSAKSDLIVSTNICDEVKEFVIGCAAQNSVSINSVMELDRLEVLLGHNHLDVPVEFKILSNADVNVNTLIISGSASSLVIVLDGLLRCNHLKVVNTFGSVTISGQGSLDSQLIAADGSDLNFNVYQILCINEVHCRNLGVQKDSLLRLKPCDEQELTTVSCENMLIEGTIFVERKLLLVSKKSDACDLQIHGPIIGTSFDSEVSIESSRVSISGQLANLKHLEFYARDSLQFSMAKLKNLKSVSIDCGELILNANTDCCENLVINADTANFSGSFCGPSSFEGVLSVHCNSLQSNMDVRSIGKLYLNCRRTAVVRGNIENVDDFEIDSKWINNHALVRSCVNAKLTAWSIHCSGSVAVIRLRMTTLAIVFVNGDVTASEVDIKAPFVVAVQQSSSLIADKIELNTLCLCTNQDLKMTGTNYLWFIFEEMLCRPTLTPIQMNNWKETAMMMKDRFSSATIDIDEMIVGLKYLSDLNATKIKLDTGNTVYKDLCKMSRRFDTNPIGLFNISDLVALIYSGRTMFSVSNAIEKKECYKKKNRNHGHKSCLDSSLYEGLVQFKSAKYIKEPRGSSDTDIGYVSRSSSEELDRSRRVSKKCVKTHLSPRASDVRTLFADNHLSVIAKKLEKLEATDVTVEELNASLLEQEELAEFELLEQEIEDCKEGLVRTDYIVCRNERIQLARIRQQVYTSQPSRPKPRFPIVRIPSSNDLVMKRMQVKATLSNLDLRSFGSEASLSSLDLSSVGEFGTPMQFESSPFQRCT